MTALFLWFKITGPWSFFPVTLIQQGILRWKILILIFSTDSLVTLLQGKRNLAHTKISSSWITRMLESYVDLKLERKNSMYFTCMKSLLI